MLDDGHLVVAADDAPRQFDAFSQLLGSERYHLLRRIVDQPASGLGKLPSVSLHRLAGRGADHPENGVAPHVEHRELRGGDRRPRIKAGDLVAREIRRHEGRTGELRGHIDDSRRVDPQRFEDRPVVSKIRPARADEHRALSEQRKVVGDISGDAAPVPAQRIEQEADGEDVGFVRNDMVLKRTRVRHDVVEGERPADHDRRAPGFAGRLHRCHGLQNRQIAQLREDSTRIGASFTRTTEWC